MLAIWAHGNPTLLAEDSENASVYRDFKTNKVVLTWLRIGDTGYFIQEEKAVLHCGDHGRVLQLQPEFPRAVLAKQAAVADVAPDHLYRAMAGLVHDRTL